MRTNDNAGAGLRIQAEPDTRRSGDEPEQARAVGAPDNAPQPVELGRPLARSGGQAIDPVLEGAVAGRVGEELAHLRAALATQLDDLATRLGAIENQLEREVEQAVSRNVEKTGEWVDSRVEHAERRLELQAAALDEVVASERDRIDAALVKLDKHRRSAKREAKASAKLREEVRGGLETLAKRAADEALEERVAAEQRKQAKALEKALKGAKLELAKGAADATERVEAAAQALKNDLSAVQAGHERAGQELEERISKVTKRVEASAETVTRRASKQEAKLARAERNQRLEKAEKDLHSEGARIRAELETLIADGSRQSAKSLAEVEAEADRRSQAAADARESADEAAGHARDALTDLERKARETIAAELDDAMKRLAAVGVDNEREDRVRSAISDAQRDSEQRVHEAEQRLLGVLAQIDAVDEQLAGGRSQARRRSAAGADPDGQI